MSSHDFLSSKEQVKETLGRFLKLLSEGCCRCDHDEAEGGLFDHCAACQREVTTIAYELFVSRRQPLATALEKFLRATDEPDARCITTPDGGCVSSDCMHTDTPTNRAQARLDAARIVDAMSAAEARSALIDAITRASVPPNALPLHGVPLDRPIWICSMCHGWNHVQDKHCTHTHAETKPEQRDEQGRPMTYWGGRAGETLAALPFTHWSKDPIIPYTGCNCSSCNEARESMQKTGHMPLCAVNDKQFPGPCDCRTAVSEEARQ